MELGELPGVSRRTGWQGLRRRRCRPGYWKTLLDRVAAANADGVDIRAQVAPRPIGVMLGLQTTYGPFQNCPSGAVGRRHRHPERNPPGSGRLRPAARRDRAEGRFELPFLIRKMTSMTAAAVGLS